MWYRYGGMRSLPDGCLRSGFTSLEPGRVLRNRGRQPRVEAAVAGLQSVQFDQRCVAGVLQRAVGSIQRHERRADTLEWSGTRSGEHPEEVS